MLWLEIVTLALLPLANSQWLFPEMRPDPYLLPLPSFVTAMNTQMKRESYSPPGHQPMYANAYPEIPFGNTRTIGGDPYADIVMEHVNEGSPISNTFTPLMDILPPSTSFIPPHSELPTSIPTTTQEITTTTQTTTTTSTTSTTTTTTTQTTTTSTTTISTTTHATTQSTHPTLLTMKETLEDNRITEKEESDPLPPSPNNRIEEIAREVQKLILNTRGQLNTDLIPPPERKPGVQAPGFSPHQVARQRRVREFDGTATTMEDKEQRPPVYDDNAYGHGKTTDGYEPNNDRIEKELTTTPTATTESIPSNTQSYDNTEGTTPEEYVPVVTTDTPNSVSSNAPVEESGYEPAHIQVEQHLQDYMEQHRQMQQQRAQMVYAETGNENYSKMTAKPVVKGTEKPSEYEQPQTTVTETPTEKNYEQTKPAEEPQPSPEATYEQSETPSPVTQSTVSSTTIGNYPDITSEQTKVEPNEYEVITTETTTVAEIDDHSDSYGPAQKPTENGHSESTSSPSHADSGDSYPIDEREEGPVITTPTPTTADEGDGTGRDTQDTKENEKNLPKQVSPSNYEGSEYSESVSHGNSKSSQAQSVSYDGADGVTPPTNIPNDYQSVPTSPPTPSQMPSIRPTKETRKKVEQSVTQNESHEEYSKKRSETRVSSQRQNENTYENDGDSSSHVSEYGQSSKSEVATESPEVSESTVAVPMHPQYHTTGKDTENLSNKENNSKKGNNKDLEYAYPTLSPNGHESEDSTETSSVPSENGKTSSSGSRTTHKNTVQTHSKHSESSSESESSESTESEEESDESKESENSEVANTERESEKTTKTPPINVDKDLEYAYPQREVKMADDEDEQPRQNNRVIRPDTQKPSSKLPSNLPADALPTNKGDPINYNQVYYVPVQYLLNNKQGNYQKNSMKTSSHGITPDESSTDSDYFIPTYNTPEELGYGRHSDHIREISSEPPLPIASQSPQLIVSQQSKTPGKQHQRIIISNLNNDKQKLIVKQDQSVLNGDQSSFAVQETKLNLSQRENNSRRRVFGRKLRKRRTNRRNVVHGQSVYYPQFIQQPFRFVSSPFN